MMIEKDKKFKMIENLKISFYVIIAVILAFLISMSVLTYNVISAGEPSGMVVIAFIWPVSIIFLIIVVYVMRGLKKTRSFIINHDEIRIVVPNRTEFQILWSEIDLLQIRKHGMGRSLNYEIIFNSKESSRSFRINPGMDFRVRSHKKIFDALESWCEIKMKDFSGYR